MEHLRDRNRATLTMSLVLAVIIFSGLVIAASTPVSVNYGEDATFSWPLPASAHGLPVTVVNPHNAPVLDWAPDCAVSTSDFYANRVRSSCKDAKRMTFTLLKVTWPDEGAYTCVTSPNAQIADCGQNLTITKVPPKVHIELSTSDTVAMETEGKQLTLTCVVTQALPPVPEDGYSWNYLPSTEGQLRLLDVKTNTLTLSPLTREDSGQYFCQAWSDPDNKWKIRPVMVSIALNTSCIDDILHTDISPQAAVEKDSHGYKATFQLPQHPGLILVQHPNTVIITYWYPPCNFTVTEPFKERVTDTSCDPCKRTLSFSLVNVTTRDLGWYKCCDGPIEGPKIDSCSVELISKVPIQVHIEPVTPDAVVKATERGSLTLTCVVTQAFPPVPEDGYSWSYLPSSHGQLQHLVGKTRTLILHHVTRENSGQYFCQAKNDPENKWKILHGNASVTVSVSYLGRIRSSSDLKVNEGAQVTLTCSVDSKPTARLAWVVEGQEVRHVTANVDHYVLERAACSDSKTYTCRASNPDLPDTEESACVTLTVNCGQASDGHEKWQITFGLLGVIIIIMLSVAVLVIVYCIRRNAGMPSKNSSQDDPGETESLKNNAEGPANKKTSQKNKKKKKKFVK